MRIEGHILTAFAATFKARQGSQVFIAVQLPHSSFPQDGGTGSVEDIMLFFREDRDSFYDRGFLMREAILERQTMSLIRAELESLQSVDSESRVMERDGQTPRAIHGCHADSKLFDRLVRLPQLLTPARELLQSDVYLYQFKINIKAAFRGDVWPWHQDYIFWRNEDGMPKPRAVNVLLFIDDVTEFNGPIYFMPGSQAEGTIESEPLFVSHGDWQESVSADLKYGITEERLSKLAITYGLAAPKGQSGSLLFFHCNVVHGSPSNISPFPRRTAIITYNAVDNIQNPTVSVRPEFLVGRNYSPLQPLENEQLMDAS
jgi:ectoine hydroxylase